MVPIRSWLNSIFELFFFSRKGFYVLIFLFYKMPNKLNRDRVEEESLFVFFRWFDFLPKRNLKFKKKNQIKYKCYPCLCIELYARKIGRHLFNNVSTLKRMGVCNNTPIYYQIITRRHIQISLGSKLNLLSIFALLFKTPSIPYIKNIAPFPNQMSLCVTPFSNGNSIVE